MVSEIAIMLNTCDKFNDLWSLFFDCIYKFWNPQYDIYVNTESLDFFDDRFNIINIHPRIKCSWSDRLYNCVKNINTKYILCIEEECLIEEKVNIKNIEYAIELMNKNNQIACIHLMHIPGEKINDDSTLPYVERKYNYKNLITQQVCIWRKDRWLKYIKSNENPWEYECLGSARGIYDDDKFYSVKDDLDDIVKYGYGFIVYRGCFIKNEIERLKKKLGLRFDEKARPIKTKEQIDKETNLDLLFYNRLRIKKRIILINKFIKKLLNKLKL